MLINCLKSYASNDLKSVSGQFGFIENKGQIIDQNNNPNPSVLYLYNGNRLQVQLKQNGFSYEVWKVSTNNKQLAISNKTELNNQLLEVDTIYTHRIDISFVNANTNAKIISSDVSPDYINYYTTGTSEQGVTNVHHYKKVMYQNIYPNIDVEFVLNNSSHSGRLGGVFKYNFIIHPGGNPNDILLKFDGANSTSLTSDGHITIETAYGNIDESIPLSYQLDEQNIQQTITANFKQQIPNIYGISVGKYDATKTLIIDPFPSTYFGGSLVDGGKSITTDNAHNIIVGGVTSSNSSIATSGAYQTTNAGQNCFVAKFNSAGAIVWSTYFGGTSSNAVALGHGVATDTLNNIFITGATGSSTNIATTGTYQTFFGGNFDAFIAKFNSFGTRQWATYYGSTANDFAYSIAIDKSGNLLIGGYTLSTSSIATGGAYQSSYSGGGDAFVAKFNSTGTSRIWATYFGGTATDHGNDIAIDQNNNVYMAGYTSSSSGISSSGAWQSYYGGGVDDVFIVKFNSSGSKLWSTYYGTDQADEANSLNLDTSGNVLITGYTTSGSGFTTIGPAYAGFGDAFILKFSSSGSRIWATCFGGSGYETGQCLALDTLGNIFLTGMTESPDSISTTGAFQSIYGGGLYDAYVAKLNSNGSRIWASYFGDSLTDIGYSIVIEWNGEILITGQTSSTSRIANSAGYQTVYGGGANDAFIASFNFSGSLPVQLMNFDAKPIGNWQNAMSDLQVLCTWQTASELNNDYFEIERKSSSMQEAGGGLNDDWKVIGKVKGNGTTNVVSSYQFTDVSLLDFARSDKLDITNNKQQTSNFLYYRLKQVDFDGKSLLSEVRVINLYQTKNTDWTIYPNPATNELHIETSVNEKFDVQLFDVTGKKVMENILFTNTTNINTSSLYQGMYFVRISDADGAVVKMQKVAVVR